MSEKSCKVFLYCNIIVLVLELSLLIWFITLLNINKDLPEPKKNNELLLTGKQVHWRMKRGQMHPEKPRTRAISSGLSTNAQEKHGFVHDILDHSYSRKSTAKVSYKQFCIGRFSKEFAVECL